MVGFTYFLESYLLLGLCVVGILINTFAIVSLARQWRSCATIFHKLMVSLVVYDLVYVALTMLMFGLVHFSQHYASE